MSYPLKTHFSLFQPESNLSHFGDFLVDVPAPGHFDTTFVDCRYSNCIVIPPSLASGCGRRQLADQIELHRLLLLPRLINNYSTNTAALLGRWSHSASNQPHVASLSASTVASTSWPGQSFPSASLPSISSSLTKNPLFFLFQLACGTKSSAITKAWQPPLLLVLPGWPSRLCHPPWTGDRGAANRRNDWKHRDRQPFFPAIITCPLCALLYYIFVFQCYWSMSLTLFLFRYMPL